ncbi:MAG: hypothetical protein A2W61_06245 [Deltaproteobacteria bacterium RIFCSPLOWO2_01_44_7]|nr:MAG: hypothetical protein A2712_01530 [Deltaproteobacteria bacterium RIFCSPHIGHO2_01_FULL_43_49]OGQ15188.1 MAG: hypothetical protein A3D22_03945 [Deltaproteobacteria bacterium RIFCSPHIGHO2_02_FULL_44_53]OGQ27191.1 MAG: hypothetical protein A3D98_02125 [Deltaproteobacteria bacterium RIFCSPHIGHO2_12_FULL_44_21]OGQ31705.1 MAG: hypothetical protein A2979_05105 [Deltaproteobacteria bacterium RIFCSPLOWO2_01_FULL_45_74]OGQ38096.1 MAG: hypothetical protein A2W61_06245 [Deltaproteobacteria bacterium 
MMAFIGRYIALGYTPAQLDVQMRAMENLGGPEEIPANVLLGMDSMFVEKGAYPCGAHPFPTDLRRLIAGGDPDAKKKGKAILMGLLERAKEPSGWPVPTHTNGANGILKRNSIAISSREEITTQISSITESFRRMSLENGVIQEDTLSKKLSLFAKEFELVLEACIKFAPNHLPFFSKAVVFVDMVMAFMPMTISNALAKNIAGKLNKAATALLAGWDGTDSTEQTKHFSELVGHASDALDLIFKRKRK